MLKISNLLSDTISNIKEYFIMRKYEKEYIKLENEIEFIWGAKSHHDLTDCEPNIYGMNDIEILYDKKTKKYFIGGVETIYLFDKSEDCKKYIAENLYKIRVFMDEKGYKTDTLLSLYDVFTEGVNINSKFDTIEELYACFKMLSMGYMSLFDKDNEMGDLNG